MLKKMRRTTMAALVGSTALLAAGTASAETIISADQKFSMETPDTNWKEVPDWETKMKLTNGKDYVTVKAYDKLEAMSNPSEELINPKLSYDEFEEVILTYYSTAKDVYVITGLAETVADINDVRSIVNSIQLSDHPKPTTEEKKTEEKKEKKEVVRTGNTAQIYYINSNAVDIYEYTDGTWKDDNGVEYWRTVDGQWANSEGSVLYDYKPELPTSEPTGNSFTIFWANGNGVLIHEYSDGTYMDDDGISYVNNGDGTWTSSQGSTLYDDENGGMKENEENNEEENEENNEEENDVELDENDGEDTE